MGYSAADTAKKHRQILKQAIDLFSRRGFDNVSVGQVMKAAGLTHGPFYNHFASKDALIAETIDAQLARAIAIYESFEASEAGKAAYFDEYLSAAHRDRPGAVCPLSALAVHVRETPVARAPFTRLLRGMLDKLADHFPWSSERKARGDAIRTLSTLVGAMVLARAVDDVTFADEILRETRREGLPGSKSSA